MVFISIPSALAVLLATSVVTNAAPLFKRNDSPKRVLAWTYANTQNPDVAPHIGDAKIGSSQIVGLLNWEPWIPQELPDKTKFQPTIRTLAETSGEKFQWVVDHAKANPGTIVHTFNEPDHLEPRISAEQAANIWNTQFAQLRRDTGCKLVTPGVTNTDHGIQWLNDFMSRIGANPPDFLGLHFYDNVPGNAINYFKARHAEHPYPIIVSEIGCTNPDVGAHDATIRQWVNEMDKEDIIFQYAIFGVMAKLPGDNGFTPNSALLMNPDGSFKQLLNDLVNSASL